MQFTINRSQMINIMKKAMNAISPNNAIPVLDSVKLDITDKSFIVTTSNEDITIIQTIPLEDDNNPIKNTQPGSYIVNAKFLDNAIKRLTGDTINFKIDDGKAKMTIKSGRAKFHVASLPGSEYPHMPELDHPDKLTITANELLKSIRQCNFATSKDENRPMLSGMFFTFDKDQFESAATDSHRLSLSKLNVESVDNKFKDEMKRNDCIVSNQNMKSLKSLISKLDPNTIIEWDHQTSVPHAILHFDNITIHLRQIEGNYPQVANLIPTEFTTTLTMNRREMLNAIERAGLVADTTKNEVVKLTFANIEESDTGEGHVTLTSQGPDGTAGTDEELNFKAISGKNLEISFNPIYIKEALQAMTSDNIIFSFTAPLRPFTITDPDDKDKQFIHLVTPIRTF